MVEILPDEHGHLYARVGNIRVTYVPAADRTEMQNWAESDVLRIQAYRDSESDALHKGAEFPVSTPEAFVDLISALCRVYNDGRRAGQTG
jgi:hypothetical protein